MISKRYGGEIVVRALEDEGIRFAFGIPGTHNIGLYDALALSEKVEPILVTDEQCASFMADAAWRASGQMACVNVVPGAGLTHALSGIAEAYMDNVPMLVLGCGIRRDTGKAYQLHDVDQAAIVRPIVKDVFRPESGAKLYATIREACALAKSGVPGPVFVEVPAEQYIFAHEEHAAGPLEDYVEPFPKEDELGAARALLAESKRPILYVGAGAARAGSKLVELAERLEVPVATTFQGKGVFPESHPLFLWNGFGEATPPFVRDIAKNADGMLAIGCRFGEVATASYGVHPPKRLLHVDIDPNVFDRNYPSTLSIHSDASKFISAMNAILPKREADRELRRTIHEGHRGTWEKWLAHDTDRVTPARFFSEIQRIFGREAVYCTDSGNGTFLAVECLRLDAPGQFLAPVDYSCMGYSIPAAVGAKLARPDKTVIALAGDGAFLMTGLELMTARAQKLPILAFVLRDRALSQIAQFQETAYDRTPCTDLHDFDLALLSKSVGAEYLQLQNDGEIAKVCEQAKELIKSGQLTVVEVEIDYSAQTYFTKGVLKTNFLRLPWSYRIRFAARVLSRKLSSR